MGRKDYGRGEIMGLKKSGDFPFKPNYAGLKESAIHYIDEKCSSEKDTVFLLLHGNPTSSYLWRNIIPYLTPYGRCIAPDLIGFGKSGKPDISYSFQDHYQYIEAFIDILNLQNIILVLHDWGGAIGFHYTQLNPDKIKGIVFMETFYKPMEWDSLDPFARWLFRKFRDPKWGEWLNGRLNLFVKFILPFSMYHKLSKSQKEVYNSPFLTRKSRKPVVMFPQELPFRGSQTKNEKITELYFEWLQKSEIPKLLLYARPGVQIKEKETEELRKMLPGLTARYIGKGKHFIQEDQPENIGEEIRSWYINKMSKPQI